MQAEITFDTDCEQFADHGVAEVFRVLNAIQELLIRGETTGKIEDDYGNVIGRWNVELPR